MHHNLYYFESMIMRKNCAKRRIIPRIDRTIRYLERIIRNTKKARDMALSEEHLFTAYFSDSMLHKFQFEIGELTRKKQNLMFVLGIGIENPWTQCDSLIEEYETILENLQQETKCN